MRAFAISIDDVLEINNPDTIFDLVSDGNQVLVFMAPDEPLHMLFPLPEGFVKEVMDSPYSHFQDFGDFSMLFLKLGKGRMLSIISHDVVVIVGMEARLVEKKSIHGALVWEIVDFIRRHSGNPEGDSFREMGRWKRELVNLSRAIEDMYRLNLNYFSPQEGYLLMKVARESRWRALDLEDRREEMRLELLKPVRRFKSIEYLLLALAGVVVAGFFESQMIRIGAGVLLLLMMLYLVRRPPSDSLE